MENVSKYLPFSELVETFGRQELAEVFREKTIELQKLCPSRFTQTQQDYILYRLEEQSARYAIEFGEILKRAKRKTELAYWCRLYLRVVEQPHQIPNWLTDSEIQRAREFPTHELYNGRLIRSGRNFKAKCLFHEERTPSFFFYADGSYHCFGCQAHGSNAIDYVMQIDKVKFSNAVRRLV